LSVDTAGDVSVNVSVRRRIEMMNKQTAAAGALKSTLANTCIWYQTVPVPGSGSDEPDHVLPWSIAASSLVHINTWTVISADTTVHCLHLAAAATTRHRRHPQYISHRWVPSYLHHGITGKHQSIRCYLSFDQVGVRSVKLAPWSACEPCDHVARSHISNARVWWQTNCQST